MDMHSNIHELHEHRDDGEASIREHRQNRDGSVLAAKPLASVECGSGWYHDAAIESARQAAIETLSHPVNW